MKVVIMQPTWLPWLGYFDLIDQSDIFIFLDTAQFEKQTWQQRNRIKTPNGLQWFTVPVFIKGRFGQRILETEIDTRAFPKKHLKQLQQNYSKAPFFSSCFEEFSSLVDTSRSTNICELNISIVKWLSHELSLNTKFMRSSEMKAEGKRGELLVNLLQEVGSTDYFSPVGSFEYLKEDYQFFSDAGIDISFQKYTHPVYEQQHSPFESGASMLDLLFNAGSSAAEVMRSGQCKSIKYVDMEI